MKYRVAVFVALLVAGGAVVASGDWDPGDPVKMHWAQTPDPTGWDVSFENKTLADDFRCMQSGPITDIHLWVSWRGDVARWDLVHNIHLSIHADIPADPPTIPYSRPQDPPLWERDLGRVGWAVRVYGDPSPQGWYDPLQPPAVPNNHFVTWQINITDLPDPFIQQIGQIYWLDVRIELEEPGPAIGWKTSGAPHFNDDAVWRDDLNDWVELRDPLEPTKSLDLAFVIVPEPATAALWFFGGLGVAGLVRRRLRRRC